jgi:hypothetical protein
MRTTFPNPVEDIEHLYQSMILCFVAFYSLICSNTMNAFLRCQLLYCYSDKDLFDAIAFFVSLYRGKVALDVAEAQHLMDGLDWQGAVKDIQASVKWLKSNGSPKVGGLFICLLV